MNREEERLGPTFCCMEVSTGPGIRAALLPAPALVELGLPLELGLDVRCRGVGVTDSTVANMIVVELNPRASVKVVLRDCDGENPALLAGLRVRRRVVGLIGVVKVIQAGCMSI